MPNAYSEDQLVEQPAIGLFAELGWQTVSAMEEKFGPSGTLGAKLRAKWCWCRDCARRWRS